MTQKMIRTTTVKLKSFRYAKFVVRNLSLQLKAEYDAIVIGAGHNGLVAAAYLQKSGLNVCVLERRHVLGGAAVTEEIVPGFKFSRASYLLSLLRPQIMTDLELKKYGLKIYMRNPSSYTPLLEPGGLNGRVKSLTIGKDPQQNAEQIAQFSLKDAKAFCVYEELLDRIVTALDPLLDNPPVSLPSLMGSSLRDKWSSLGPVRALATSLKSLGKDLPAFYELMTAPAQKILNRWFESEPLKATLATDSVIGAMISPMHPGSGYVLLHHVMGEIEGVKGAWGYVEGGMGGVSQAIANCAQDHGAAVFCNKQVSSIIISNNSVKGVVLSDGTEIRAKVVLSNATAKITYLNLVPQGILPEEIVKELETYDYTSPVTKINVAVDRIPNFMADPNIERNKPMPHHRCSIHINCENSQLIHDSYLEAQLGKITERPMIEMVIPSSLDPTLCPPGKHVVLLFTQFTPYKLADGDWNDERKNKYADIAYPVAEPKRTKTKQYFKDIDKYIHKVLSLWVMSTKEKAIYFWRKISKLIVFDSIENYAPGFKSSVIGRDILAPPDLESIFGLTGGNIFHGSLSLDQLYLSRPTTSLANYRCPISGLYLCGSSSHPGGGVMGATGRLAAYTALGDFKGL